MLQLVYWYTSKTMVISAYIIFLPIICLISAQNCDNYLELATGEEYYINNPTYPQPYTKETSCVWDIRTIIGSKIFITCNVELPLSDQCKADKLWISLTGDKQFRDVEPYCGSGSFSLFSEGTALTARLYAPPNTQQGRFLCTITAIKNNNPSSQALDREFSNCDCGWKQMNRIIGGQDAGLHEFPYMAGLIYNNQYQCGASIISDRFALSAGHCVVGRDPSSMFLLVGDHNIQTGSDTSQSALYPVNAYEVYPTYDPKTLKNDMSILRTAKTILFNQYVGPICLPFRYTYESFAGQPVIILGWGSLGYTEELSATLQKAQVTVLSRQQCISMQVGEQLTDGDMCTYSEQPRDTCQNDSGGPVIWFDTTVQRYQLIGIISRGPGCGINSPAINTRVSAYLQWVVNRTSTSYCIK